MTAVDTTTTPQGFIAADLSILIDNLAARVLRLSELADQLGTPADQRQHIKSLVALGGHIAKHINEGAVKDLVLTGNALLDLSMATHIRANQSGLGTHYDLATRLDRLIAAR